METARLGVIDYKVSVLGVLTLIVAIFIMLVSGLLGCDFDWSQSSGSERLPVLFAFQ